MTAGRSDLRAVRLRRRGKHTTPSQVEKVALQAGKAAPAVAIAGALVAAPAAQHALAATTATPSTATNSTTTASTTAAVTTGKSAATTTEATLDSFETKTVTVAAAKPARHASVVNKATYYKVREGDSLSTIARKYYGHASDWQYLFHVNEKTISNPNVIYEGEKILLPASVPGHYALTDYAPKHAKRAVTTESAVKKSVTKKKSTEESRHSATITGAGGGGSVVIQRSSSGTFSCAGLEQVWEEAGGSAATAHMAAEIAKAESGGNPNAISPTDDFGLWQINASNGSLATLNAEGNAHSAVLMSDDGRDWDAWTTYHSGAYYGKC
jgi:LysM repeat protein